MGAQFACNKNQNKQRKKTQNQGSQTEANLEIESERKSSPEKVLLTQKQPEAYLVVSVDLLKNSQSAQKFSHEVMDTNTKTFCYCQSNNILNTNNQVENTSPNINNNNFLESKIKFTYQTNNPLTITDQYLESKKQFK